jgi:hypothetical protein
MLKNLYSKNSIKDINFFIKSKFFISMVKYIYKFIKKIKILLYIIIFFPNRKRTRIFQMLMLQLFYQVRDYMMEGKINNKN